jgi:hypothetical protein
MRRTVLLLLAPLLVLAGGCGQDHHGAARRTSPTSTAPGDPTASVPGTPTTAAPATAPRPGLPSSYPVAAVPLLAGRVHDRHHGSASGVAQGWMVTVSRRGSARDCFDAAGAALLAHGFTRQVAATGGGEERAQFTSPAYAVLLTATGSPGGRCSAAYTVGALGG